MYELAVFSSGATLTPGQTIMEIVPADDTLVLTVEINPRDIERVRPGQPASVHLLPFNRRYQSLIRGRLELDLRRPHSRRTGRSQLLCRHRFS